MESRKQPGSVSLGDPFVNGGTDLSPLENRSLASKFISRCRRIQINKPLIPLKVCLFFFFGGSGAIAPFLQVFIVQKGITVKQMSAMYMINPVIYFVGPTISGIIADKIGHAKPVFIANMLLAVISLNCMLLVPSLKTNCLETVRFKCHPDGLRVANDTQKCRTPGVYPVVSCEQVCHSLSNETELCTQNRTDCQNNVTKSFPFNLTQVSITVPKGALDDMCPYVVDATYSNASSPSCLERTSNNCTIECQTDIASCVMNNTKFALLFGLLFLLMMTFTTVMSNCFRMLDVTAMFMVNDHNSDFGRVRFWSILSSAMMPPLAGFLVDQFTLEGAPKYYAVAIYLFNGMMFITSVAVCKLDVRISPPGKKMWKKTLALLREPEYLAFSLALLILGTSWGLTKNFSNLYLKQLGASSLLLGLIVGTSNVAGLPFLVTSNWWMAKIGTLNVLLLAFVGYITYFIGYFLMVNPWLALLFELTTILTYHLLWVAVVRHSHETAPDGLVATVVASAGGIHYGIGKGTGSLVGGWVKTNNQDSVDPFAYLAAAGTCAISVVSYGSFLFFRRNRDKILVVNKSDEKEGSEVDEIHKEMDTLPSS